MPEQQPPFGLNSAAAPVTQPVSVPIDDEPIVDVALLMHYLQFIGQAMHRRRALMLRVCFYVGLAVAGLLVFLPRYYRVSTRILTHRSLVMPALVHPDRSIPQAADAPTAGAVELIKSRDNLENLMTDTKLEEKWEKNRSVLWKSKDKVLGKIFGALSRGDQHEAFLKLLDERLSASVIDDVVAMDVEWPDAEIAMSLSEGAVARFLKLRHDMELSEISETVTILVRNVENSRQGIEQMVARMQKIVDAKERGFQNSAANRDTKGRSEHRSARKSRVIAIRRPIGAEHIDPALEDLKRSLTEKQSAILQLKRNFEARLKTAQTQLNELRASLGPNHPDVLEAKRNLDKLQQTPAELMTLQAEEAHLATQMSTLPQVAGRDEPKVKVEVENYDNPGEDADLMRVPVSEELYAQLDKDPEIASVMEEIKKREDSHDELLQRLANARIESETANAAFEYRYIMTMPPIYPKKVIRPNVPMLGIGGGLLAVLLSVVFAVLADVQSRIIYATWQLERFLKLKNLGEVKGS